MLRYQRTVNEDGTLREEHVTAVRVQGQSRPRSPLVLRGLFLLEAQLTASLSRSDGAIG
jgi:hypothetical protein